MPWGLKHFQQSGQLHFLTFSCYRRQPNFATPHSRGCFESSLERVRQSYGLCVYGYVVMPEDVHLLVNEPERGCLAQTLQSLKQSVAPTLALCGGWPNPDSKTTLQGASLKLRLGGDVRAQIMQFYLKAGKKVVPQSQAGNPFPAHAIREQKNLRGMFCAESQPTQRHSNNSFRATRGLSSSPSPNILRNSRFPRRCGWRLPIRRSSRRSKRKPLRHCQHGRTRDMPAPKHRLRHGFQTGALQVGMDFSASLRLSRQQRWTRPLRPRNFWVKWKTLRHHGRRRRQ